MPTSYDERAIKPSGEREGKLLEEHFSILYTGAPLGAGECLPLTENNSKKNIPFAHYILLP